MIVNGRSGATASRLPGDSDRRILSVGLDLLDAACCGKTRRAAFDDGAPRRRASVRTSRKIALILVMAATGCSSGAQASIANARAALNPWVIPFAIAKRWRGGTPALAITHVLRADQRLQLILKFSSYLSQKCRAMPRGLTKIVGNLASVWSPVFPMSPKFVTVVLNKNLMHLGLVG